MWSPELVLLCLFRPSVFVPVSLWLIWTFTSLIISFLLRTGMEHLVATKHSRGDMTGDPRLKKIPRNERAASTFDTMLRHLPRLSRIGGAYGVPSASEGLERAASCPADVYNYQDRF